MAGSNNTVSMSKAELQDLRAWRALIVETHGVLRDLESLRFALERPAQDTLAALGLGGSEWALERFHELRHALDLPVVVPDMHLGEDGPELDAAA